MKVYYAFAVYYIVEDNLSQRADLRKSSPCSVKNRQGAVEQDGKGRKRIILTNIMINSKIHM